MDQIVVFGGSGFIGSHVADELTCKGYDVVIFDKVSSPYLKENQTMVVGDVLDRRCVREVMKTAGYIYHFAGVADIGQSSRIPWRTMHVNVMGTCAILDACAEFHAKRFIFASSMYVYSGLGSFYRVSKQSCEKLIEEYAAEFGLDYTILRLGSPYGPRANDFNPIKRMLFQALHEKKITCYGTPDELREYIHVADVARLCVNLLDQGYRNKHLIMTGNQTFKLESLAQMLKEILGNDMEIEYLPKKDRHHYQMTPYSYKPEKALKVSISDYHDLGQGLLELLYEML